MRSYNSSTITQIYVPLESWRSLLGNKIESYFTVSLGAKPFACNLCSKTFRTKGHVKSHKLNRHIGVKLTKSHICPECGQAGHCGKFHFLLQPSLVKIFFISTQFQLLRFYCIPSDDLYRSGCEPRFIILVRYGLRKNFNKFSTVRGKLPVTEECGCSTVFLPLLKNPDPIQMIIPYMHHPKGSISARRSHNRNTVSPKSGKGVLAQMPR